MAEFPDAQVRAKLYAFLLGRRLGVLTSLGPDGAPQSALMNIAVTPDLEIIFETTCETRKFANIERDPRVSLVIGCDGQESVQYEGRATRPQGQARERLRDGFVAAFPAKAADEYWPGNHYFLVTPVWLRFSSYYRPRRVEEYRFAPEAAPHPGLLARLRDHLGG